MSDGLVLGALVAVLGAGILLASSGASALDVRVKADKHAVPMGGTVAVEVVARADGRKPATGCRILPYVNGRRWGAHEITDASGRVRLLLPLPNPGPAEIQVQALPSVGSTHWIWAPQVQDAQTVRLCKTFKVTHSAKHASLRIAVDDSCRVTLNGHPVGEAAGWKSEHVFEDLDAFIVRGENVLCVEAENASGPAGLAAELTFDAGREHRIIATDASWAYSGEPSGEGPVHVLGRLDGFNPWSSAMQHWPGIVPRSQYFVGRPVPNGAVLSNALKVQVERRAFTVHEDPEHLIGIQWEPWFTPHNAYWQTAQAVPVVGFYDSYDRDVIRQHALWLMDAGVNFIFVDWSNHIWGKQHWNERPPSTNEIIHATTLTLEAYAAMREEGLPVPKVVIMPGLSNGPPTTMEALNEELDWMVQNYLENPRFESLWVIYEGKPLVVPLDCAYLAVKPETPPVDDSHFTVRWMGTQLQANGREKNGYWSWMDGSLEPIVTYRDGVAEVVTPTPAYFGHGGWLYPEARGRRGGTTFIESFKTALRTRPRFTLLHQWNEFAGQREGRGYGSKKDIYVDSYSVELSDDLEPVSLTADGYRGDMGGWGFYYLNLIQALVRIFHQEDPEDAVMAVWPPERGQVVTTDELQVSWAVAGRAPTSYTLMLDGKEIAEDLQSTTYVLSLADVPDGPHEITVIGEGAKTHFPLSYTEMDTPRHDRIPLKVSTPFTLHRR